MCLVAHTKPINCCPTRTAPVLPSTSFNTMSSLNKATTLLPSPATEALEEFQRKMMVAREGKRAATELKLTNNFLNMTFDDETTICGYDFPQIEWDDEESDSDSSLPAGMDMLWSSHRRSNSDGSFRKRSSSDISTGSGGSCRRLVRSKKIKSNLSTLGMNFNTGYLE